MWLIAVHNLRAARNPCSRAMLRHYSHARKPGRLGHFQAGGRDDRDLRAPRRRVALGSTTRTRQSERSESAVLRHVVSAGRPLCIPGRYTFRANLSKRLIVWRFVGPPVRMLPFTLSVPSDHHPVRSTDHNGPAPLYPPANEPPDPLSRGAKSCVSHITATSHVMLASSLISSRSSRSKSETSTCSSLSAQLSQVSS